MNDVKKNRTPNVGFDWNYIELRKLDKSRSMFLDIIDIIVNEKKYKKVGYKLETEFVYIKKKVIDDCSFIFQPWLSFLQSFHDICAFLTISVRTVVRTAKNWRCNGDYFW